MTMVLNRTRKTMCILSLLLFSAPAVSAQSVLNYETVFPFGAGYSAVNNSPFGGVFVNNAAFADDYNTAADSYRFATGARRHNRFDSDDTVYGKTLQFGLGAPILY